MGRRAAGEEERRNPRAGPELPVIYHARKQASEERCYGWGEEVELLLPRLDGADLPDDGING